MRTYEEIGVDVSLAMQRNDVELLLQLADELLTFEDQEAIGRALNLAGWAAYLHGEYHTAISKGLEAASIFEAVGNRPAQSRAYGNVGLAYNQLGEMERALQFTRMDLALKEELKDKDVTVCYGNLGLIYVTHGQFANAFEAMNRALDIATASGNDYQITLNIGNLGNVYWRTGNYPQALDNYYRALEGYERLGNKAYAAVITGNIGGVLSDMQKPSEALTWHERALAQYSEVGGRYGMSQIHKSLATDLSNLQRYSEALEHLDLAQALSEEIGNKTNIMSCMLDRCNLLREQNNIDGLRVLLSTIDVTGALPELKCSYAIVASYVMRADGDLDGIADLYTETLAEASAGNARKAMMTMHGALRDVAKERMEFEEYVRHSEAYQSLREELHGAAAMDKVAVLEKERAIAEERSLRDKERSILYSTLPPAVADRIIAGEDVSGDVFEYAVVLFLDIVGFTTHSGEMTPQDTTALLAEIFISFDEICESNGVTKIKTIGDSYLAVAFPDIKGQTSDHAHAHRAASAALKMIQTTFVWPDGSPLQFRVGMHSGPLVAGVIGNQRLQYDVWGDTVNVASRLESTSEPGRIHVSTSFVLALKGETVEERKGEADGIPSVNEKPGTWHLEPGTWHVVLRGETELKGKGMMTTYWLESA